MSIKNIFYKLMSLHKLAPVIGAYLIQATEAARE